MIQKLVNQKPALRLKNLRLMELVKIANPTQEPMTVEKYAGQMSALQFKNFKQMELAKIVMITLELLLIN
jgi:hypothetical protein